MSAPVAEILTETVEEEFVDVDEETCFCPVCEGITE